VVITTNIHVNRTVGRLLKGNIKTYARGGGGGGGGMRGFRSMGLPSVASLRTAIRSTTTPNTNYIML